MKYRIVLLILFSCFAMDAAKAQQTGSFNDFVQFDNERRMLSCFVPQGYDANQSYRLVIGLHGLGDNSPSYRNALVNALGFEAAFPNTILICPDGGSDASKDFYTPAGDEEIIQEAIRYATANYNVDVHEVILQGFSLGGRSALRYGLDHPDKFSALLLNTPAIQGVKEADNGSDVFRYDFSNAHKTPVFITVGTDDPVYHGPIEVMMAKLASHNAPLAFKKFNGGHTVPALGRYPYLTFFDHPYSAGPDASLYQVAGPVRSCDGDIAASVLLQNTGNEVLRSAKLTYGIGNNKDTFTWQGSLATHEHAQISLPVYRAGGRPTNTYGFEVSVLTLNAGERDTFADLNNVNKDIHIMTSSMPLPFTERFDYKVDLEKWAFNNSGDYILPFYYDEDDGAVFCFNSIFIFDNSGTKEEIVSPRLNFSTEQNLYLHFSAEYNYTKYTASFLGEETDFADTLEVLVSSDCGLNYTSVFRRSGAELSSYESPILNPRNMDYLLPYVDKSKYRSFHVDVSAYAGQPDVQFKFSYISGLGGYIYLDDVLVNNNPLSVGEIARSEALINLYPNPASEMLQVSLSQGIIRGMHIFDISGRMIHRVDGSMGEREVVDVRNFPQGTYLLKVYTDGGQFHNKFVVQ